MAFDQSSAEYNLLRIKEYLKYETNLEYKDEDPLPILVDKIHNPPRFKIAYIGDWGKKYTDTYRVSIRKDCGGSYNWETKFFSKASDAAGMINLVVKTWEHNNRS